MDQEQVLAGKELSRVLMSCRHEAAAVFAAALQPTPKWQPLMAAKHSDWENFLQSEFFAFVDYLARYVERDDNTFRQLFIGEKIKALYDPALDDAQRRAQAREVGAAERAGLARLFKDRLSTAALALLDAELAAVEEVLSRDAPKTQHILLVGDCLFLDIVPFIVGDLLEAGIAILPDYATSKNPLELRQIGRAHV